MSALDVPIVLPIVLSIIYANLLSPPRDMLRSTGALES